MCIQRFRAQETTAESSGRAEHSQHAHRVHFQKLWNQHQQWGHAHFLRAPVQRPRHHRPLSRHEARQQRLRQNTQTRVRRNQKPSIRHREQTVERVHGRRAPSGTPAECSKRLRTNARGSGDAQQLPPVGHTSSSPQQRTEDTANGTSQDNQIAERQENWQYKTAIERKHHKNCETQIMECVFTI